MPLKVQVQNVSKNITDLKLNLNNTDKRVRQLFVNDNGTPKLVFTNLIPIQETGYNIMTGATTPKPFIVSAPGIYFKEPWQLFTDNVANAATWNTGAVITQDLLRVIEINEMTYYNQYSGGGADRGAVGTYQIQTSLDGVNFTTNFTGEYKSKTFNNKLTFSNLKITARYLRLIVYADRQQFTLAPIITKATIYYKQIVWNNSTANLAAYSQSLDGSGDIQSGIKYFTTPVRIRTASCRIIYSWGSDPNSGSTGYGFSYIGRRADNGQWVTIHEGGGTAGKPGTVDQTYNLAINSSVEINACYIKGWGGSYNNRRYVNYNITLTQTKSYI